MQQPRRARVRAPCACRYAAEIVKCADTDQSIRSLTDPVRPYTRQCGGAKEQSRQPPHVTSGIREWGQSSAPRQMELPSPAGPRPTPKRKRRRPARRPLRQREDRPPGSANIILVHAAPTPKSTVGLETSHRRLATWWLPLCWDFEKLENIRVEQCLGRWVCRWCWTDWSALATRNVEMEAAHGKLCFLLS